MKSDLQTILNRIVQERGIGLLDNAGQCKALLHDYAKGAFKREIHLFLQSLEAGCHRELLRSEEPERTKARLIRKLHEDYGITLGFAQETIDLLGIIIENRERTDEEKIARLEKAAKGGDYRSQYELGLLFKKIKKYEASIHWLEIAAKHCMSLYEQARAALEAPPAVIPLPDNFVRIPGGTFDMGSPAAEWGRKDNENPHEVQVRGFYLGIYPVTQREYEAVIGTNPSKFKGPDLPVEYVNWFDAVAYCNARSIHEERAPVYKIERETVIWRRNAAGYRLPTEAEWEYACRAGTRTPFNTGNNFTTAQGNYNGRYPYNTLSKGIFRQMTTPAGSFDPNPWGLYDMHGNVWEWCWDWYGQYGPERQKDPPGPSWGADRVYRGGSWSSLGQNLRSASRGLNSPSYRNFDLGFRVLLPV